MQMDEMGVCLSCGEKLVSIDIDPKETENFTASLTNLVRQREVEADFMQFQGWGLRQQSATNGCQVIDGANVGLINRHNFNFSQLNSIVNQLHQMRPSKRLLLLVLHKSHVTGGPAQSHNNKKLLENWKRSGALYATPAGSNDDCVWIVGLYGGSAFPSASHR
ncbi:proteinaceous RNase P 1, chloroplastic/mitochondrial-like isoform X1 [Camellia sinensis]|uniref:proteinaceous RNase P 1, chloroplastic/mitochondrial-like isoform X1 n=1 Tax=Camellia sinensis TaxID=4442 RepID=UPI001035CD6E|nr:proteinaceous RNase P 1, chloroplastic/mitochondrial-like isoform X1 [Camellia sinensis]XP_028126099.1 proteinaceous RNase P 1, chloroplastic/mitochondrial-like isoform X1 [Camellia sinensis]XP_028126100.1 proteinaceous RNase P 1, chloroplastic/mitochondrial-like isoform X1 [Camellia sinensis]XP_028126101.1 proteinaceous RNase P 1, chloroplastic/mitochondrial-like isoform X1 [Camellia sinensis]XP_028126102.1 proteinaceous RNase P 1, chloroplastic/mitochondrial-like isoform X1 [Camellia sinen